MVYTCVYKGEEQLWFFSVLREKGEKKRHANFVNNSVVLIGMEFYKISYFIIIIWQAYCCWKDS